MKHELIDSPLESGLNTHIQFYATQLAQGMTHTVVKLINLSAQYDDPRLNYTVSDAVEICDNLMELNKYLTMLGVNLMPDETWEGYEEMRKYFDMSKANIYSRLSDTTKNELKYKGITL
jgi:hypothetical protein